MPGIEKTKGIRLGVVVYSARWDYMDEDGGCGDRVCFVEKEIRKHDRRNIHIFEGRYITATYRSSDGHVRLNFKQIRLYPGFNTLAYATGVMYEIQKVLNSLVEKE